MLQEVILKSKKDDDPELQQILKKHKRPHAVVLGDDLKYVWFHILQTQEYHKNQKSQKKIDVNFNHFKTWFTEELQAASRPVQAQQQTRQMRIQRTEQPQQSQQTEQTESEFVSSYQA